MPLLHCDSCHHEWEAATAREGEDPKCDWCGSKSYVLEETTPLKRMLDHIKKVGIVNFLKGATDAGNDKT